MMGEEERMVIVAEENNENVKSKKATKNASDVENQVNPLSPLCIYIYIHLSVDGEVMSINTE